MRIGGTNTPKGRLLALTSVGRLVLSRVDECGMLTREQDTHWHRSTDP